MKKAIYALSADPITYGHIDIILRAASMFDKIIVGIGDNPNKNYTLTSKQRKLLAQKVFENNDKIKVEYFTGSLVDFSSRMGANVIVRGLRNVNDFQYEQELSAINKSLKSDIETCFIISEPNKSHISSSSTKAIIKEGFNSIKYIPMIVKKTLEKEINSHTYIGITGLMGSGKSYIAEEISKINPELIHNVDLDKLCHVVYEENNSEYNIIRNSILNEFGTLNRKEIGKIVFNDSKKLKSLNDIFREPIKILLRNHCKNLKGIILINGATIVAENFLDFVNNKVIFVSASESTRYERCLKVRKIDKEIIQSVDKNMLSIEEQLKITRNKIKKDCYGSCLVIENNENFVFNFISVTINDIYDVIIDLAER